MFDLYYCVLRSDHLFTLHHLFTLVGGAMVRLSVRIHTVSTVVSAKGFDPANGRSKLEKKVGPIVCYQQKFDSLRKSSLLAPNSKSPIFPDNQLRR